MITRQLKQQQYQDLHNFLQIKGHTEAFEASYTVDMTINGTEYAVKLQPERHCKIAVLQALQISPNKNGSHVKLITSGSLLSSFLEVLLYQKIGK